MVLFHLNKFDPIKGAKFHNPYINLGHFAYIKIVNLFAVIFCDVSCPCFILNCCIFTKGRVMKIIARDVIIVASIKRNINLQARIVKSKKDLYKKAKAFKLS